jgi:hypothetical protein
MIMLCLGCAVLAAWLTVPPAGSGELSRDGDAKRAVAVACGA